MVLGRTESAPSYSRLEKAISNLKPESTETDSTTNFWTVYKKVADEHDDNMASKYLGDLDTSLLFVSAFISLVPPLALTRLFFRVRLVYSQPLPPRSLSKSSPNSSQTPQT